MTERSHNGGATAEPIDPAEPGSEQRPPGRDEQFRMLLSSVTDFAVFTADAEGFVTSWNDAAERMTGFAAEDVMGRPRSIFYLSEDESAGKPRRTQQLAARDGRVEEEGWRVRKDGSQFYAHAVTTAMRDNAGRLRGYVDVLRDLSERRETDADIARLADIVESSQEAIIGKDLNSTILSWNHGAENIYGYSRAEALGRSFSMLVPPDRKAEYERMMNAVRKGKSMRSVETQRIRKDGSLIDISMSIAPVRDACGKCIGMSVVAFDTTARKRDQDALRQSEARLRAVLDTAIDAVITIDHRGAIQSINRATERMFGYNPEELVGQNVSILMPAPYRDEHDDYIARFIQTGEKRIIGTGREVEALRKDGTVFPIELAVSEVEPRRLFTGMIRDISERKTAELRLREADRMASIGALAAGLGHDMNNVLLPVMAHLNAASASNAIESIRDHLKAAQKSVNYLRHLADGLHYLAMNPDQADDGDVTTDLTLWWSQTSMLLSKAVPPHVKVTARIPEGLPSVAAAPHALTQAVLNLIVNAGEAIPPGRKRRQGHVRVWATLVDDGSAIRVGVTDNGTGMTEEIKRRAFDLFFTTKPRGLGTGLGLPMVRKVVDHAGGSIDIKSAPGKGTTFAMILPVADHPNDIPAPVASVLISDPRTCSLCRALLQSAGAQVEAIDDPQHVDILIASPDAADLADIATWRHVRPDGRLVLFGQPDGPKSKVWEDIRPDIIIERTDSFESIRASLSSALTCT